MKLKIKRLDSSVNLPTYAHIGDAAFDLYASRDITLKPGERMSIPTGLSMEIPDGHVGLIWDKSGLSHKHGLKTFGGVIDAGYRGEILVGMMNLGTEAYTFEKNHKLAQMIIQKREKVDIIEVEKLSDTDRSDRGIGSTGK